MKHQFCIHDALVETINEASTAAGIKCKFHFGQSLALGVVAAAYLALATTLSLAVGATIESASVQKLVMGAVFPVGLIAVVVAVSELSTGNYLTTPLGAMTCTVSWRDVLSNWAASYAGNFLGAFLLAAIIIRGAHVLTGAMWGEPWVHLLTKIVTAKASLSPTEAFWRGFLCIWLVDLAIWQSYRVKDYTAKFLLIFFPTFAFFSLSLEHSVVNMFLFPAAIFSGAAIPWKAFLLNNLVPVVLGNVVGGTFIVGMVYWFSAGLPLKNHHDAQMAEDNHHIGPPVNQQQGALGILGSNVLKASGSTAVFLIIPAGAAGLAIALPQSLGVLVPIAAIVYVVAAAYGLFLWRRKGGQAKDFQ